MSFFSKIFKKKVKVADEQKQAVVLTEEEEFPADKIINCEGMTCPKPIFEISQQIKSIESGKVLKVTCTDPAFKNDVEAWCRRTENKLIKSVKSGNKTIAYIVKK